MAFGYIPSVAELHALANRPDYCHYLGMVGRIGFLSFITFLEHDHFDPCDLELNARFKVAKMQWPPDLPGTEWFIVSIPHRYREIAEKMAARFGLHPVNQPPAVAEIRPNVVAVFAARPERRFPGAKLIPIFNTAKCFTLEYANKGQHFAFENNPALHKKALEAEVAACHRRTAESKARWDAMHPHSPDRTPENEPPVNPRF